MSLLRCASVFPKETPAHFRKGWLDVLRKIVAGPASLSTFEARAALQHDPIVACWMNLLPSLGPAHLFEIRKLHSHAMRPMISSFLPALCAGPLEKQHSFPVLPERTHAVPGAPRPPHSPDARIFRFSRLPRFPRGVPRPVQSRVPLAPLDSDAW